MYYNEENTRGGLIKSLLLKLLFVIILILVLVWLFPTKNALNPLYQGIFRDNLNSMKDAAETYFTNDRLPSDTGDSVKLTLEEMLNKNLLLPFTDKHGNACDLDKSYVEITKTETEYELKVNLSCSTEEAFVIEHMGCNDKCAALGQYPCCVNCTTTGLKEYEFKKEIENKEITGYSCPSGYTLSGATCKKEVTTTDTKNATPVYEASSTDKLIGYRCEVGYELDEANKLCKKTTTTTANPTPNTTNKTETVNATPNYTGKTETINATVGTDNKTETINATASTQTVTNYLYKYMKEVTTTKYVQDTSQPIRHYTYDNIIGYYTKNVCTSFNYFVDQTSGTLYQSGNYVYSHTETVTTVPNDTTTKHYEVIGIDYDTCKSSCQLNPYYKVKVYTRTATAISDSAYSNLSVTCNVSSTQVPIYGLRITFAGYVTYPVVEKETLTAWAPTWNDATLLSQNYGFVNIRKENGTTTTTTYTCPTGYTQSSDKKTCSKVVSTTTYTCPAGYTQSSDKKTCSRNVNTITSYTCPAGYTQSSDKKTCSKVVSTTTYTCPAGYTHDTINNTCKKSNTTSVNAIPVYETTTTNKIIGYKCDSGYTLNSNNTCTTTRTLIDTKNATPSYKTSYGVEYMWSEKTYIEGWTRTGREREATQTTSDNSNKQK